MPDLRFQVEGAEAVPHAATPLIALRLRITDAAGDAIHSVALRCQVQIEAHGRPYALEEEAGLADLFGARARWPTTLRSLLWAQLNASIPGFEGSTHADLQLPCTYDLNVAATKYFHSLAHGVVPLLLLFSGTVFYTRGGGLQISQIPWSSEARFSLPVKVWKDAIDAYFPNTGFVTLQRDVLDRLYRYKVQHGLPSWDRTIETLLGGGQSQGGNGQSQGGDGQSQGGSR